MSYFQDLSEYTYSRFAIRPGTLNVGWLDPKEPFRTGAAVPQFVDLLWEFCCRKVVVTRGFCGCYLCTPQILDVVYATRGEKTLKLGSAEIRVFSSEGKIFAAPDLIYHYVT